MIRVVVQHAPNLYALSLVDEAHLQPVFEHNGETYYRAETHAHWILYKRAVSGWGETTGGTPDARQR